MEYESSKTIYRIVKRTYHDRTIKFVIQMKTKFIKNDNWSDLYIKFDTVEKAIVSVGKLIKSESAEQYIDEIL